MMRIEQLQITNDNAWDILSSDNIYLIRFSKPKSKKSEGHKKEMPPIPYGLSLKNLSNISISEVVKLINSGEGAIVRVTTDES